MPRDIPSLGTAQPVSSSTPRTQTESPTRPPAVFSCAHPACLQFAVVPRPPAQILYKRPSEGNPKAHTRSQTQEFNGTLESRDTSRNPVLAIRQAFDVFAHHHVNGGLLQVWCGYVARLHEDHSRYLQMHLAHVVHGVRALRLRPEQTILGHGSQILHSWAWQIMLNGFCPRDAAACNS